VLNYRIRGSCTQVSEYLVVRYLRVTFLATGTGWSLAQLSSVTCLDTVLEGHVLRYPGVTFSDT
jgi:hypothetical protein